MANLVMFCILAAVILGCAIMCVVTTRIMRAVTFLLFVLLGVAGIYFLLDYTYLGAAQISVYAGGIAILYVFAIQLVSKHTLQGLVERMKGRRAVIGVLASLTGLATMVFVMQKNEFIDMSCQMADKEVEMSTIGKALVGADKYQYVLPFEFVSLLLLACIIGGIVMARKQEEEK